MSRIRTTLLVNEEFIRQAHEKGLNISRFLEQQLRSYLQGNGSQQQPLEQPETPNIDFKTLFTPEVLNRLRELGFDIADNNPLRKIVENALNSYVLELELVDDMRNA